ncbi:hypothetical protein ACX3PU_05230 [Chryseobacterium sp. A301]
MEGQIKDQVKPHEMSEAKVVEEIMLKKQAVKSFVPIEKIADLCVFLATDNASAVS